MKRILRRTTVRPDVGRDVADELRFHLEMRTQEFMEAGLSRPDAERAAREAFGDVGAVDAELRLADARHARGRARRERFGDVLSDLRFAVRTLRTHWGFALAALMTLTLGIGAAVAVFTVADGVLLRPLPYPDPERLEMVWFTSKQYGTELPLSSGYYVDAAAAAAPYAQMAAFRAWNYTLTSGAEPEQLSSARVTPGFFAVMAVAPTLGRAFTDLDALPGAARVAILSDALWRRRFGADPAIVGKYIDLGGESFQVVGIMPPGFVFPRGAELPTPLQFGARTELWTPLAFTDRDRLDHGTLNLSAIARLRPGARAADLSAALAAELRRFLAANAPKLDFEFRFNDLRSQAGERVRGILYVLLGAVALLLVIACVNVANLLIARTSSRARELAVRAALGASRSRLARQLVTENLLLGACGTVCGLALAALATRAILGLVPWSMPRADDIGIGWHVLVLCGTLALGLGALFGLAVAAQVRWSTIAGTLQHAGTRSATGRSANTVRRTLVVAELALSVMLLVAAALLTRSFVRLESVDPGFSASDAATANVVLPLNGAFDPKRDAPVWARFFAQLVRNVGSDPSVAAAGAVSALPLTNRTEGGSSAIVGMAPPAPGQAPHSDYLVVEGDYFRALGIRVVAGRPFTSSDVAGSAPVAIVNREYARRYLNGRALGRQIITYFDFAGGTPRTIVGVIDDVQYHDPGTPISPQVYVAQQQMPYPGLQVVVRGKASAAAALVVLKRELRALDPHLVAANPRTMEDVETEALAQRRFGMTLIGIFAASALALAMVGLYGVIALAVSQRQRELSLRIALGAGPRDIVRLVLGDGLRTAVVGVLLGLAGAAAAARVLAALLYEISPTDIPTYAAAAVAVTIVAAIASWAPARRAGRVDAMLTLRGE